MLWVVGDASGGRSGRWVQRLVENSRGLYKTLGRALGIVLLRDWQSANAREQRSDEVGGGAEDGRDTKCRWAFVDGSRW